MTSATSCRPRQPLAAVVGLAAVSMALCTALAAGAGSTALAAGAAKVTTTGRARLIRISSDPFTNASAQHATEADPSISSYGSTVVAAFDQGVFADGSGA